MGEVIDINAKQPHNSGEAICVSCKHTWVAVAPVGLVHFECPECSLLKGVFKSICMPDTFWECKCGCNFFCIHETAPICIQCGSPQRCA